MDTEKKILIVQLYSNGDCLYATAVARQIKQDFPDCHLTWMIARFCKDIIANNPFIDDVIVRDDVPKNDVAAFRRLKREVFRQRSDGKWDKVFITHNMDDNQALYDGTIRGMIFRAYPGTITVPIQPVVVLTETEKQHVQQFVAQHDLKRYANRILWEYAPQSGQSILQFDFVMRVAEKLTSIPDTCIILSSANSFSGTEWVIDGSPLSVRENAELMHHCTLLIGCSSGITWLSTSSAGKALPMLQLLDGQAYFRNAPSIDFKRYGISSDELIELVEFDEEKISMVVNSMIKSGALATKMKYNEQLPVQFKTTRKIVYNMLCYLQFKAIFLHYRITRSIYGNNLLFIKEFTGAFLTFPFKLIRNRWRKRNG